MHVCTTRPVVSNSESLIGAKLAALDHGFVRVIDYMGNDNAIVQAARVSYGAGTKTSGEDERLIRYLMRNRHTSPFEMCEIKLHVKLPIFVARQWIRHRTASVNEYSMRYSEAINDYYVPNADKIGFQSSTNKQTRTTDTEDRGDISTILDNAAADAHGVYSEIRNMAVPRELARTVLPLSTYTEWYWKIDLHNLLHFLSLRADPHAQYEIRAYAECIMQILQMWVPITHRAFIDYRLNAQTLSGPQIKTLRLLVKGSAVSQEDHGLTVNEWNDIVALLHDEVPACA